MADMKEKEITKWQKRNIEVKKKHTQQIRLRQQNTKSVAAARDTI
jgi:hypothetical protein